MKRQEMLDHIVEQDKEIFDLIAKVIEVITSWSLWEEDSYTFKDGETWNRFDPDLERAKTVGKLEEYNDGDD